MFAILGATGKVGFSTSSTLRETGVPIRAIVRDETKAGPLKAIGCDIAIADLNDPAALVRAFSDAHTVQVILPPPTQAEDAVGEMRRSIESIAQALEHSSATRVLAISDYGAHVEDWIGMPSAFRLFEERLRSLKLDKVILRSAEHMEGWAAFLPVAAAAGVLPSLHHPLDELFPTISAPELGRIAADLLLDNDGWDADRIIHAEGPRRYSAADIATVLSELLGRPVAAQALPRNQWTENLERILSPSAAQLLVDLYDAHNKGGLVDVEPGGKVVHGSTTAIEALRPLVTESL